MTAHTCPHCGADIGPGDEFCRACGSALRAGPPEWQGYAPPPTQGFVIGEVMRDAWRATLQNLPFLVLFTLVLFAVEAYVQYVLPDRVSNGLLLLLFSLALSALAGLTQTTVILQICDGRRATVRGLFARMQLLPEYIGVTLLFTAIVVAGLFLLVLPGIFWAIKFGFAPYIVVDTSAAPLTALRLSSRLTDGQKWNLFKLGLVCVGVLVLGVACLLVGLLVASPLVTLAYALVYRRLLAQRGPGASVTADPA